MNMGLINKHVLPLPYDISRADFYRVNTDYDGYFGLWRADYFSPTFIVCELREKVEGNCILIVFQPTFRSRCFRTHQAQAVRK
jgi:hypothetical protein